MVELAWQVFKHTRTEDVPELPGLYAWSLNFVNPQEFVSPKKFLTKYDPYIAAFRGQNATEESVMDRVVHLAHLHGTGAFGDQYSAQLQRTTKHIKRDADISHNEAPESNAESAQQILKSLFNESYQVLSAPLYIGKSDNLKRRVNEHLKAVEEAKQAKQIAQQLRPEELIADDDLGTFARRLVSVDLDSSMLLFTCIAIDPVALNMTLADAMYWIEEAEYYFNNISRPSLGRK